VNPGLQATLHVYRGCRWVDPADGNQGKRGKRPKKERADGQPAKKGAEEGRPQRGLGVCVRYFGHISE
jgi:hypothetical protein